MDYYEKLYSLFPDNGVGWLINTENGSFKVWGCQTMRNGKTDKWTLITCWGRIGTPASRLQKREMTDDYFIIYDYLKAKIEDKMLKGYRKCESYGQLCEKLEKVCV